jgi:hypothetical protein
MFEWPFLYTDACRAAIQRSTSSGGNGLEMW